MIKIGNWNEMTVVKELSFGFYLDGGEHGEILIPAKYLPVNCKTGDTLRVFIYKDSEDRIIATTQVPLAEVGNLAYLRVKDVNTNGAFLDWGLEKDLFVAYREQNGRMEVGRSYLVYVYLDATTERVAATARVTKYIQTDNSVFKVGQEVDALVYGVTDLGYKVLINNTHTGVFYKNEVFANIKPGYKTKAYIKKLREDGKIDLSLQKFGYEKVADVTEIILTALERAGGFLPVTDKSSPELIYSKFGMSKKTFKQALGSLYKQRLIELLDNGIKKTI